MGIGLKIKELRNKAGMTQKELADKLLMTYQAISRWENDEVEPSIDSMKEMCKIFNCSMDDLLGTTSTQSKSEVKVVEKVIVREPKPILGICDQCRKPIYQNSDLHRIQEEVSVRTGRHHHKKIEQKILCTNCNNAKIAHEKEMAELAKRQKEEKINKKRKNSFIFPIIIASIFFIIGFASINSLGAGSIALFAIGILAYLFSATMILNNTFIPELWLDITSWGFVELPGIIFDISFDGIIFLIVMKIVLFFLGILLAILAALFATFVAMVLSVFVYPFALRRNIKGIE